MGITEKGEMIHQNQSCSAESKAIPEAKPIPKWTHEPLTSWDLWSLPVLSADCMTVQDQTFGGANGTGWHINGG